MRHVGKGLKRHSIAAQLLPGGPMRAFQYVGHVGTIRADRQDAAIMLAYARARVREDAAQAVRDAAWQAKFSFIPKL